MDSPFGSYKRSNCDLVYVNPSAPKTSGVYLIGKTSTKNTIVETNSATTRYVQRGKFCGSNAGMRHKEWPVFGQGITAWTVLNIFLAEFIGTGTLLFLGCMSVILSLNHMTICLAFGLAVATIIQTFGHISVAHLNPSVSVAAVVLGKINAPMCGVYIVAQCLGAVLGYGLLLTVTPEGLFRQTCCTVPNASLSIMQAMGLEYLITAILIFLLCGCWDRRNATKHDSLALKFGFAITALALAGGPYTGGSMNPARSFAPALWHNTWTHHWVYWLSPLAAGLSVSAFYRLIFDNESVAEFQVTQEEIPLNAHNKNKQEQA